MSTARGRGRQSFAEPALQAALRTYLATLDARDAELAVLETQLRGCRASVDPLASMVRRLGCYRGIAELTALTLAAEVAGFRRFASAPAFMGLPGLTPSEYSSGARTRRGGICCASPAATALRAGLDAGDHCGPPGRKSGAGPGLPLPPARPAAAARTLPPEPPPPGGRAGRAQTHPRKTDIK